MQGKFRLFSLRNQIVILFVIVMFFSLLILGGFMTYNLYVNSIDSTYNKMNTMIDTTADSLNQSFSLIAYTALGLAASDSVSYWLQDPAYFDKADANYYLKKQELNKEFAGILTYNNTWKLKLFSYVCVFFDDDLMDYNYVKSVSIGRMMSESSQAYQYLSNRKEDYILNVVPTGQSKTIFHARKLQSDFASDNYMVILLATEEQSIRQKYSGLLAEEGALVYLVDNEGQVLSSNEQETIGQALEPALLHNSSRKGISTATYQNADYIINSRELKDNGLTLIYMLPYYNLVNQIFDGMKGYILISLVLVAVLLCVGTYASMQSTAFMKDFITAMNSVKEKNYNMRIKKYHNAAVNELGSTFNEMTAEIKTLIQTTYESELLHNQMQIKFLQQQMNPHFLFNVLMTIQIKAKKCKDDTIYQMIASLSSLLRAGIYGEKSAFIPISEELQYVNFYLYLQKMRFEDKLSYSIDIEPEELGNMMIPKLTIEPMVENAVVHGIESLEGEAQITVKVTEHGDDLMILIEDNGVGFDIGEEFGHEEENPVNAKVNREKIGLKNVNQRIKLIYGEAYGLTITSTKGVGTKILICVPKKEIKEGEKLV